MHSYLILHIMLKVDKLLTDQQLSFVFMKSFPKIHLTFASFNWSGRIHRYMKYVHDAQNSLNLQQLTVKPTWKLTLFNNCLC